MAQKQNGLLGFGMNVRSELTQKSSRAMLDLCSFHPNMEVKVPGAVRRLLNLRQLHCFMAGMFCDCRHQLRGVIGSTSRLLDSRQQGMVHTAEGTGGRGLASGQDGQKLERRKLSD